MTPSADKSAAILTRKLIDREPFIFVRLGDADVPWMLGRSGIEATCDGEPNRERLGAELMAAWQRLCACPSFLCGDLLTMEDPAAPEVQEDFKLLCSPYPGLTMLHSEALLLHRLSPALKDFYRVVRRDSRRKILVAPHRVGRAAQLLGAAHIPIHSTHAHEEIEQIWRELRCQPWEVALLVAGRASKLLAGKLAATRKTVIELGSALDPLFYGQTRGAQIPQNEARAYFSDLWWE